MLKISKAIKFLTVMVLSISLIFTVGCFGSKGGSTPAVVAPSAPTYSGNIVPESVVVTRSATGDINVEWKTKTPTKASGVLAGNLFFKERPLYSSSMVEKIAAPAVNHSIVLKDLPKNQKAAIAVIDGDKDISDNSGLGYIVK